MAGSGVEIGENVLVLYYVPSVITFWYCTMIQLLTLSDLSVS